MVPDTCLVFITKYIAIARIMESSVCNPFAAFAFAIRSCSSIKVRRNQESLHL